MGQAESILKRKQHNGGMTMTITEMIEQAGQAITEINQTEKMSAVVEVTFNDGEVIMDDEFTFSNDDFESARDELVTQLEEVLGYEYEVESFLVDGYEVEIRIFDEDGEEVGSGTIHA